MSRPELLRNGRFYVLLKTVFLAKKHIIIPVRVGCLSLKKQHHPIFFSSIFLESQLRTLTPRWPADRMPTYFGAFPYFLRFFVLMGLIFFDIIWNLSSFLLFPYPNITRSIFSDIFWPLRLFFLNFFLSSCQLAFNDFCQNIEHEFET